MEWRLGTHAAIAVELVPSCSIALTAILRAPERDKEFQAEQLPRYLGKAAGRIKEGTALVLSEWGVVSIDCQTARQKHKGVHMSKSGGKPASPQVPTLMGYSVRLAAQSRSVL